MGRNSADAQEPVRSSSRPTALTPMMPGSAPAVLEMPNSALAYFGLMSCSAKRDRYSTAAVRSRCALPNADAAQLH